MSVRSYQICGNCVMDTSDPDISFDKNGVCGHCANFDENFRRRWFPNEEGRKRLLQLVQEIKEIGKNKEYDCILGLSGGVDSSYLAYQAKELGLRPLLVHVDAGWNSEIAVRNIEKIVKTLGYDLYTHVVNWEEIKDLQRAFFMASVANLDIPQDHAFFAVLYSFAVKNKIRWVLNGFNIATESILPRAWGYNNMDSRHIRAIHKRFGTIPLKTYPMVGFFKYNIYFPYIKKMKVADLLNYMPYNKDEAIKILEREFDWKYYGGKHYESRFTKFFQSYYLPTKFGFDKRRAHLSSLVLSGQMTRQKALEELAKPAYTEEELKEDKIYIMKKLGMTEKEFEECLNLPQKTYRDYPSNEKWFKLFYKIRGTLIKIGVLKN